MELKLQKIADFSNIKVTFANISEVRNTWYKSFLVLFTDNQYHIYMDDNVSLKTHNIQLE